MILCTGHGRGLARDVIRELGFAELLDKPIRLTELAAAVRSVLDTSATSTAEAMAASPAIRA